jgi:hypothetical protein
MKRYGSRPLRSFKQALREIGERQCPRYERYG